jgi:hypothetical protein
MLRGGEVGLFVKFLFLPRLERGVFCLSGKGAEMRKQLYRLGILLLDSIMLLVLFMAYSPSSEKAAPFPTKITDKLGRAVKVDRIP